LKFHHERVPRNMNGDANDRLPPMSTAWENRVPGLIAPVARIAYIFGGQPARDKQPFGRETGTGAHADEKGWGYRLLTWEATREAFRPPFVSVA
jgi:hypothetical protein